MEGAYLLEYFANFKIQALRCKNSTTSKVICKSDKEIDDILTGGSFQFFYTDRYLDVVDFKNPMKEYLSNYFIKLDPYNSRFVDIYFKTVNISSDSGYVFSDVNTTTYAVFDYYREQFDIKNSESVIITFYVNSSNHFTDVTRAYMKLTELLATVGGILNVCLVIGEILAQLISGIQMKLMILNTLFYFDSPITEKVEMNDLKNSLDNENNPNQNNPNNENHLNNENNNHKDKKAHGTTAHTAAEIKRKTLLLNSINDIKPIYKRQSISKGINKTNITKLEITNDSPSPKKGKLFLNNYILISLINYFI